MFVADVDVNSTITPKTPRKILNERKRPEYNACTLVLMRVNKIIDSIYQFYGLDKNFVSGIKFMVTFIISNCSIVLSFPLLILKLTFYLIYFNYEGCLM